MLPVKISFLFGRIWAEKGGPVQWEEVVGAYMIENHKKATQLEGTQTDSHTLPCVPCQDPGLFPGAGVNVIGGQVCREWEHTQGTPFLPVPPQGLGPGSFPPW